MRETAVKLVFCALLPVFASVLLYLLDKKTPVRKVPYMARQVLYGLVFGGIAIFGTEYGVPMNGAQLNCRDAAVLTAGLMFGAPAGIIAGVMGGVERWFSVYWGVGSFTRLACSLSTFLAGVYAALLRKSMFEDKKPGWVISFAIGVVMEVFHLTMVFITNMATPEEAMAVVKACTTPMVLANGVSVLLASFVLSLLSGERTGRKHGGVRISQTIQRWLLFTVLLAFAATSYFVYGLQDAIASTQTDELLELALDEVSADIEDASDENLLRICRTVARDSTSNNLDEIARRYNVAEISLIGPDGVIYASTEPKYLGFDMASGAQSAAFLCLLDDTKEFVQDYGPITSDPNVQRKYAGVKTADGFIQVGYDASRFQKDIDTRVQGLTKNRHVGKTGFILIVSEGQEIVSAPEGLTLEQLAEETAHLPAPVENMTGLATLNGVPSYCRYRMTEGYYLVSVLPESEALQLRNIALYVNTFMEILVFAILFGLIYLLIKRVVVNQIKKINGSLGRITGGDLGVVVDVRTNEEFASLSDDINSTVDTLKHYIDEASARIDKELEFAKSIQRSALPSVFPAFPKRKDFDIYALMDPAKEVGGDFYDFYMTGDDTLNFLVADVSGKGIPAAMFMMRAKTELKRLTEEGLPLSEVFTSGNAALCEGNEAGMFVTAWEGSIDLVSGNVKFANAGHNPPLVKRGDGKFTYLKSRAGFVLAGMEDLIYKTQEFDLQPGDTVFLYTDGVTEATNGAGELYGDERLLSAINSREFATMKILCDFLKAEVDAFVGDAPQFDDITMVAFRYIGSGTEPENEAK